MYTDFECSNLRDSAFDECDTPSGLKAAIEDCGPGVIGVECVRELCTLFLFAYLFPGYLYVLIPSPFPPSLPLLLLHPYLFFRSTYTEIFLTVLH